MSKYPRTYHLPFSPGGTSDDKVISSIDHLNGIGLTISEKIDGSNTSLSRNGCFSRSHSGPPDHPSFDAFKALHSSIKYMIPEDIFIYGEWCWAKHSIAYNKLPAYFLMFGVKDMTNKSWLSWSGVELWAKRLGLTTVPVVQKEIIFETTKELQTFVEAEANKPSLCGGQREGLVLRKTLSFSDPEFSRFVIKYVNKSFIEKIGDTHWKYKKIQKNKLE